MINPQTLRFNDILFDNGMGVSLCNFAAYIDDKRS